MRADLVPSLALPLVLSLLAAAPVVARADDPDRGHAGVDFDEDGCTLEAGPDDLVAQDQDLVVPPGRFDDAVVLRGDVVVQAGAQVRQVVALGGSVVVERGARVIEDAIAIGGDVRVARGGLVRGDAVALGGQVKAKGGDGVEGEVVALSLTLGGKSLAAGILKELREQGPCRIVAER